MTFPIPRTAKPETLLRAQIVHDEYIHSHNTTCQAGITGIISNINISYQGYLFWKHTGKIWISEMTLS